MRQVRRVLRVTRGRRVTRVTLGLGFWRWSPFDVIFTKLRNRFTQVGDICIIHVCDGSIFAVESLDGKQMI